MKRSDFIKGIPLLGVLFLLGGKKDVEGSKEVEKHIKKTVDDPDSMYWGVRDYKTLKPLGYVQAANTKTSTLERFAIGCNTGRVLKYSERRAFILVNTRTGEKYYSSLCKRGKNDLESK